jgi:hypothetical protein
MLIRYVWRFTYTLQVTVLACIHLCGYQHAYTCAAIIMRTLVRLLTCLSGLLQCKGIDTEILAAYSEERSTCLTAAVDAEPCCATACLRGALVGLLLANPEKSLY